MSLELELAGGDRARIESSDGERVTLLSDVAAPPGATLSGALAGEPASYSVKVRSCRRDGGLFRIEGRFVNLSRAQRARIVGE
jgi:hypothetical protein